MGYVVVTGFAGAASQGASLPEAWNGLVNMVVLAGTVSADPVQRRMPSGDEVTAVRLSLRI
jgi:hypothetical protein